MNVGVARLAVLSTTFAASLAWAGYSATGPATATVNAKGPAGFKIVGTATKVNVVDDGTTLTVSLRVADVDTENGLRNRHMQEDLEAEKYPIVSLAVPLASLKEGAAGERTTGTFSIHGQSKEIPFTYSSSCAGSTCDVSGKADVNLKDFGVKIRSYLGVTVKPDITVSARFQVKK